MVSGGEGGPGVSELPEGACKSMERIAQRCAATFPGAWVLGLAGRYDAALMAITEYAGEHGWPAGDLKPLFRAGSTAISRATRQAQRHLPLDLGSWREPPGLADSLAEAVTDRIGIRQLVRALPDAEWEAVWALAEVMKLGGGYRDGAALLGISAAAMSARLSRARQQARELWVAPGETPTGRFCARRNGKLHKFAGARYDRKRREAERDRG